MPAPDKLLTNAGGLLMAAGGIAAFAGGLFGLGRQSPGLVVLSVLLLIGYGIVGYLLVSRGARHFSAALPLSALLVLATLYLFQQVDTRDFGGQYFLDPAVTLVLAFAGGALLTHALEDATDRVEWPGKAPQSVGTILFIAAYAPIWNAFVLLDLVRAGAGIRVLVIGASVIVAVACIVGGYAATRKGHPAITLAGASAGFLASVYYLFNFMRAASSSGAVGFGQINALVGLILTGLPIAIATVAWIQLSAEEPPVAEPPSEG